MDKQTHAPEPWIADKDPDASAWDIRAPMVQGTVAMTDTWDAETDAANARLIAAAPDLLEALERVACSAETAASILWKTDKEEAERFRADAAIARAAIARARADA